MIVVITWLWIAATLGGVAVHLALLRRSIIKRRSLHRVGINGITRLVVGGQIRRYVSRVIVNFVFFVIGAGALIRPRDSDPLSLYDWFVTFALVGGVAAWNLFTWLDLIDDRRIEALLAERKES